MVDPDLNTAVWLPEFHDPASVFGKNLRKIRFAPPGNMLLKKGRERGGGGGEIRSFKCHILVVFLSTRFQKMRKDLHLCVRDKQLASHALCLTSRPESLNCGVKPLHPHPHPHPEGQRPPSLFQGSEDVHHQAVGGRGGVHSLMETGAEFLPCWTGRGRGGAEREGQGSSLGRDPLGPGDGLKGVLKEGCWGGALGIEQD